MGQYAPAFEANDIDLALLSELTDDGLRQLGVSSLGHRLRLLAAIKAGAAVGVEQEMGVTQARVPEASQPLPLGERRQATVLFSDLSGYTAMNERLDPEEVRAIMARIKAQSVRTVEAHGGIVNQFVGDEVMALFGIPHAHEDDAVRAVRAALALHAMVRELEPTVAGRIGAPLRLHSGISAGLVVTGSEDRRDGTVGVTGDAVNTGARLAAQAGTDDIWIAEEVQRVVADYFRLEAQPPVALKGKAGQLAPYRVLGLSGVATRFEAAARRGFTAYAGRHAELAALQGALERARAGQGQFVTVMGEPGIGKSRLLFEFRHAVDSDDVQVITGYCQHFAADTPYLPFIDALRRALRLDAVSDASALHDTAVNAVQAIAPALRRYLPQYLHLLSIASTAYPIPATLQGDALRRSFEESLTAINTELARARPCVLILEDWHWADEASEGALRHLAGLVPQHALMVVLTHRPEYERKWPQPQNYHALALQPLDVSSTAAMLRAVWGAQTLPEGLASQIHARTGGNALFNEEVARALLEDGRVAATAGTAVLQGTVESLQLPDTVHATIRARVDRLDAAAREVLRLGSVIGREFALPLLERLHDNPAQVPEALERLRQQDLIQPVRVVPEATYLFKHALVQDVVYDTLLLSVRRQLHARTGSTIEALYAERIEEFYETLADHYGRSEDTLKAVVYLEKAGDKALAVFQAGSALAFYRAAVNRLAATGQDPEVQRARIRIGIKWGRLSWLRPADVLPALNEIIAVASALDDKISEAKLIAFAGIAALYIGDPASKEYFERALEKAGPEGDLEARGLASQGRGQIDFFSMNLQSGYVLSRSAAAILAQLGSNTFHRVNALSIAMMAASARGDRRGTAQTWDAILEAMQGNDDQGWWTWWNAYRASVDGMFYGTWQDARRFALLGIEQGRASGNAWGRVYCEFNAGIAKFYAGDPEGGLTETEKALVQHLELSGKQVLSMWYGQLAEMQFIHGEMTKARRSLAAAQEAVAAGDWFGRIWAMRVAAMMTAFDGDHASAARGFEESIDWCRQREAIPHLAVTRLRSAEILHRRGDTTAALTQLNEAQRLFREVEMDWWDQQAVAVRARLQSGVPFNWFVPYADRSTSP